jgi:integrase
MCPIVADVQQSEALITLALTTGGRVSELLGLTWDRVDLPDERKPAHSPSPAQVRIDRALQYRDGNPVLVETKTPAGRRTLELTFAASGPLRRLRSQQNENALRLGKAWSNEFNLVFTTSAGRPLTNHAVLYQYLRPLLSKAGLPAKMKFHDLRHVCASLLLANGVPVPVVAALLGHANPSITMSIYSHALPDSQHVAATAMDALLGN